MSRRRWWPWFGVLAASIALAGINPTNGLPYREDFEQDLTGWNRSVSTGNDASLSTSGASWSGAGAFVAEASSTSSGPEASIAADLDGGVGSLSVRFYLLVPSDTQKSISQSSGAIRIFRADGPVVNGLITLDLLRAQDPAGTLYLQPTVGGIIPVGVSSLTSLTPDVWHSVEVSQDGLGTFRLYIDDPRVPRLTMPGATTLFGVTLGITTVFANTGQAHLQFDDVVIAGRRVGLAATQNLVSNEYESTGLSLFDFPAGKGAGVFDAGAITVVAQSTDVHRGLGAMTVTDSDSTSTLQGGAVFGFLDRLSPTPLYRRVWWRWPLVTRAANHTILAIIDSDGGVGVGARYPAAVQIGDDGSARLWGVDDRNLATYGPNVPLQQGPWHLVELYAAGFGTDAGVRRGWVDGVPLGTHSIPFVRTAGDAWAEGVMPIPQDFQYAGTDSFDDARSSTSMLPTRFTLRPVGTPTTCTQYDVTPITSDNIAAPVPETVDVALDGGGTALFYSTSACTAASGQVSSVRFLSGTQGAAVFVHPVAPDVTLSTSAPDYLPWSNGLGPDAGTGGPASALVFHGLPLVAFPNNAYPFAVEALDGAGATATSYMGTVAFASAPACSLPPAHGYTAQDRGYFVFGAGGVTFPAPGTYQIHASDGAGLTLDSLYIWVLGPGQVAIVDDANTSAVVGHPYVYNALGAVTAVSTAGPPRFSTCNTEPSGFTVDDRTGAVRWTPDAAGNIPVCVQATAGGSTTPAILLITVTVAPAPPPGPPTAGFVVRPTPAQAGAFVVDDPVGSTSPGPLLFRWRFGDGAWPGTDRQPFHRFVLPGGYRTHLTVWDSAGRYARADQPVQVGLTRLAPTVRIDSAQPLEGNESLSTTLEANVSPGSSPTVVAYRWDLGGGTDPISGTLDGGAVPGVPVTYGPGRYFPRLMVVDGNGLVATDKAEVVVSKEGAPPPDCLATLEPTVLVLSTLATGARFRAFQVATGARLRETDWRIDGQDQPQDQAVVGMAFDAGGWHHGELSVRDEDGLYCRDGVDLAVIGSASGNPIPPRIVDPGNGAATCGQGYDGGVPVASDPIGLGVTWTLENGPPGATMDGQGRLSWTPPPASTDPGHFTVRATSSAGSDVATATVTVECEGRTLKTCGCGAEGGLSALAALFALGAWGRRRARR